MKQKDVQEGDEVVEGSVDVGNDDEEIRSIPEEGGGNRAARNGPPSQNLRRGCGQNLLKKRA